ncbi:hypothetical protein [Piscinibacter sp. HJYY11]|uniref:hypothetical protein n=1 Tax=Piscinibacter sp. HJYY11 TaxID=2801333 RepID=UPI00191DD506|nr:hypothetical protein [Piscinibacter sp. HJYY11]MBL0727990.1 hypothetical protein [Piscinibacter sp. HJYY11]
MKFIGVPLRRPGFNELTAAAVMGSGLWVLAVGLAHVARMELTKADAGALLLVMLWACVSARIGIRVGAGGRHLAANLIVSGLLLAVYEVARGLF